MKYLREEVSAGRSFMCSQCHNHCLQVI